MRVDVLHQYVREFQLLRGAHEGLDILVQDIDSRTKQLEADGITLDARATTTESAMVHLGIFREDAAVKIDMHKIELERNKSKAEQLRIDLGDANTALQSL